ncbi:MULTISPECIES: hypothetical protein [Delftia]|uniref:hypothetical protein n=1 Tax=Delftia TaxID=80865 RepID=UPI0020913991|nr:hypothetical protein [Delftia tsuruhatensis]MCO5340293.1 hypothetical protein [Delftia tsuruhatensis]MCR4545756.1 hypothetical protein [Delftia tsuruhatensis]
MEKGLGPVRQMAKAQVSRAAQARKNPADAACNSSKPALRPCKQQRTIAKLNWKTTVLANSQFQFTKFQ